MAMVVDRITAAIGPSAQVKVGVEAAGHYHRPVLDYAWPTGWEVSELNPAHITEQRGVAGRRRIKTDAIDLEAITELVLAGLGQPVVVAQTVLGELAAWVGHRGRRVAVRSATKNQLLGQLDLGAPAGLVCAACDPAKPPRAATEIRRSETTQQG
jgi:transposase